MNMYSQYILFLYNKSPVCPRVSDASSGVISIVCFCSLDADVINLYLCIYLDIIVCLFVCIADYVQGEKESE